MKKKIVTIILYVLIFYQCQTIHGIPPLSTTESTFTEEDHQLLEAINQKNLESAKTLLGLGANPNALKYSNDLTPLMVAAFRDDFKMINLLAQHGADPNKANAFGWNPILLAAHHNSVYVIRALKKNGANLNFKHPTNDLTPFLIAASRQHTRFMQTLQELGVQKPSIDTISEVRGLDRDQKRKVCNFLRNTFPRSKRRHSI